MINIDRPWSANEMINIDTLKHNYLGLNATAERERKRLDKVREECSRQFDRTNAAEQAAAKARAALGNALVKRELNA